MSSLNAKKTVVFSAITLSMVLLLLHFKKSGKRKYKSNVDVAERSLDVDTASPRSEDYAHQDFTQNTSVTVQDVPTSLLRILQENGIVPPRTPNQIKVVLDVVDLETPHTKLRYFWSNKTKDSSRGDWVPASTVKIFAALGALLRLNELGLGPDTNVEFKDTNQKIKLRELVYSALVPSDNMSYNRLVQLAGHDKIKELFSQTYPDTELNKPYLLDDWKKLTRNNTNLSAPEIVLNDSIVLPRSPYSPPKIAGSQQACTTLVDLNNVLYNIVMDKTELSQENAGFLKNVLETRKQRGEEFSNSILRQIQNRQFRVFSKHGFNGTVYSQAVLLLDIPNRKLYTISAVGSPGDRTCLNDVGRAIGQLLNKNTL